MEIKTKYDLGDILFFIKNNEITSGQVTRIEVCENLNNNHTLSNVKYIGIGKFTVAEDECFTSIEDLFKFLHEKYHKK
jgi:hypothetical protein